MNFDFTDIVLYFTYLAFAAALGAVVWSVWHSVRAGHSSLRRLHGVPVRRISLSVVAFTAVVIIVSLLLSSAKPVLAGGKIYEEKLWLRMTDVCLITLGVMLVATIVVVLWCNVRKKIKNC